MTHAFARGKFLEVDGDRFLIRGVTYGPFTPESDGRQLRHCARIASDFAAIASLGANTVRCYTPPSVEVLDEAARHGLRVMIGVPWRQHTAFLDRRETERDIRRMIRDVVRQYAAHPAALLFAVGNEIPATVVRWYGRQRIERFLRELYDEAKSAAPDALLTYANYPPTEFLDTSGYDVAAFNIFLHRESDLRRYLARLHHVAGPRPLLVSEAGADSIRNGDQSQAALVAMQVRAAFREGACGAVVFSWTDEWWRGGRPVDDWAFGLVDADRRPKLSHRAVQQVFRSVPFRQDHDATWPRVSVVVCAYNAEASIDECLASLDALTYPNAEIIVVNDGSTDATRAIAARHSRVRLIDIKSSGLAAARNVGLQVATGVIVAYTDADVRVDPDWLTYLVQPFVLSDVVGAGGPNVVPDDDPWMAQAVARAPGAPTHVLIDDQVAEHVPGCNCAFRREALIAIGGFDPTFVRAGDDVDVCWRLQARGWRIGFAPAALVWHHHRSSVRGYLRQQVGYGEGETWLMREHPDRFVNGRAAWRGHIYSPLPFIRSLSATRINAGPFGSAGFPSVYRTDAHPLMFIPHSGRWQLTWMLAFAVAAGIAPVRLNLALAFLATGSAVLLATVLKCAAHGSRSDLTGLPAISTLSARSSRLVYRGTIAVLHFLQPFARMWGRLRGKTSGPRIGRRQSRTAPRFSVNAVAQASLRACVLLLAHPIDRTFWTATWTDVHQLFTAIAQQLQRRRSVRQIHLDSGWWEDRDVSVVDSAWFRLDVRALVEDHGLEGCLYRFRTRLHFTARSWLPAVITMLLAGALYRVGHLGLVASGLLAGAVAGTLAIRAVAGISGTVIDAIDAVTTGNNMLTIDHAPPGTRLDDEDRGASIDVGHVLTGLLSPRSGLRGAVLRWHPQVGEGFDTRSVDPLNAPRERATRAAAASLSREL